MTQHSNKETLVVRQMNNLVKLKKVQIMGPVMRRRNLRGLGCVFQNLTTMWPKLMIPRQLSEKAAYQIQDLFFDALIWMRSLILALGTLSIYIPSSAKRHKKNNPLTSMLLKIFGSY